MNVVQSASYQLRCEMSAIKVSLLPIGSSLTRSLSAAITMLAVSECNRAVLDHDQDRDLS